MPFLRSLEPLAIRSRSRSRSPTVSSAPKKERVVGFNKDPVSSFSRPLRPEESWSAYHFEMHARKCAYCHRPYHVHRSHQQLCEVGHRLAQAVARHIYNKSDGETYSTVQEDHKLVRVEVPTGYVELAGLLKAMERSLRRRSREPFVSMDRSYYVAPRSISPVLMQRSRSRSRSHSHSHSHSHSPHADPLPLPAKRPRPRSGEIVDWPECKAKPKLKRVLTEINRTNGSKRGSLYEEDLAKLRRDEKQYAVEVREPSPRTTRTPRLSVYYR